jgi:hypothetical protein
MQRVTQTKTLLPSTAAMPFIVHERLMYILCGAKTFFDVYILKTLNGNVYRCITQFGEEIIVKFQDTDWIDVSLQQPTNTSKALGKVLSKVV